MSNLGFKTSAPERLELIGLIWDSIPERPDRSCPNGIGASWSVASSWPMRILNKACRGRAFVRGCWVSNEFSCEVLDTGMMPIPSHLTNCVVPKDATIDESPLDAFVRCPCGSSKFDLLFPGQTHQYGGETIPCTAEIGGKFFFWQSSLYGLQT